MTLKATPLNSVHRASGAKMVDFGGWDMPVNYGSQIEEHHAVRSDAGKPSARFLSQSVRGVGAPQASVALRPVPRDLQYATRGGRCG